MRIQTETGNSHKLCAQKALLPQEHMQIITERQTSQVLTLVCKNIVFVLLTYKIIIDTVCGTSTLCDLRSRSVVCQRYCQSARRQYDILIHLQPWPSLKYVGIQLKRAISCFVISLLNVAARLMVSKLTAFAVSISQRYTREHTALSLPVVPNPSLMS